MTLKEALRQILWEAYEDGCRRCEADLWRFVGPLNDWVYDLLQRPLPVDWRARLGAYLDSWEPEGFDVAPDQRQILENWIHAWAELLGLLPEAGRVTAVDAISRATQQTESIDDLNRRRDRSLDTHLQGTTDASIADRQDRRNVLPVSAQLASNNVSPQLAPVTIYIDLTIGNQQGRPNSLNAQTLPQIQREMNNAFANAGINLTVTLVPTAPPKSTRLGFEMQGIIGFRTVKAYNHTIGFKVGQGAVGLAMTGKAGQTVIVGNKLESRFPRITPIQWANIFLHEVIYLGLGIGNDDNAGPAIKRGTAGRTLVDLSPIKDEIISKLKK